MAEFRGERNEIEKLYKWVPLLILAVIWFFFKGASSTSVVDVVEPELA